jgi:methanogenic corrinoid protein MtbC1
LITVQDLADAIDVSASSVRRWVDTGDVRLTRTAGGHRRLTIAEAVRFIRASGATVVRPQILGLPAIRTSASTGADDATALFELLRDGDAAGAHALITSWYVMGRAIHEIFDGPMRGAMSRIGLLWTHDECGILIEHRASDICVTAVHALRALLPPVASDAPVAVGAAPAGDFYLVPSLMAATVLRDAGFGDVNYGANMPLTLLARAAREHKAKLAWVSMSTELPVRQLRTDLTELAKDLAKIGARLAVGGRVAVATLGTGSPNAHLMSSMTELFAFARGAAAAKPSGRKA